MILLTLIYMSFLDVKYLEINNLSLIMLLVSVIFTSTNLHYILAVIYFLIFSITYRFIEQKIGGGDIKVIGLLIFKYGFEIFKILFIASAISILILLLFRKITYLPFIPFITLGVVYVKI